MKQYAIGAAIGAVAIIGLTYFFNINLKAWIGRAKYYAQDKENAQ